MELKEFEQAFQAGVDSGGNGIVDPTLFGCDTHGEAMETLCETYSTPLWDETHVYQVRGAESCLVGINAKSKEQADEKLERQLPLAIAIEEYVGELNDLIGGMIES